jgi:hypothetical protein
MGKYLISALEEQDLIEISDLFNLIQSDWNGAEASFDEGNISFSWRVIIQNHQIDGRFLDGDLLVMDGDINGCSEFAIWYRKQINESLNLAMYDESYSVDISLTSLTTPKEIVQAFCITS